MDLDGFMGVGELLVGGLDTPDFASVLADGTIAGEFAAASDVMDRHLEPFGLILEEERVKFVSQIHEK
jgi:hypothetical protein